MKCQNYKNKSFLVLVKEFKMCFEIRLIIFFGGGGGIHFELLELVYLEHLVLSKIEIDGSILEQVK